MTKLEQLIKELAALVEKPEIYGIIQDKMYQAFYAGTNEESQRTIERLNRSFARLKEHMPKEELERMEKTHFFHAGDDFDPECNYCGITTNRFDEWPEYCLTKAEKEKN